MRDDPDCRSVLPEWLVDQSCHSCLNSLAMRLRHERIREFRAHRDGRNGGGGDTEDFPAPLGGFGPDKFHTQECSATKENFHGPAIP